MDSVASAASAVVRQSTLVIGAAADELARQANAVVQATAESDPISWIAGDDDDLRPGPSSPGLILPAPIATPLAALTSWGAWGLDDAPLWHRPFSVEPEINSKLFLWQGDLCSLEVDALLAPVAAGYTPGCSTVFGRVLQHGGPDLREELRHMEGCRSGEARSCKAYNLPCQRLLLTVGPKYKDKYQVAAQNTLNACYRESMQLLVESGHRTVAVPCYWYSQGYPMEEQAHVGLRTLRRCLEKLRASVDSAVLVAGTTHELELYESLLPLYFPRNEFEARHAAAVLPDSCWNEWGEVSMEERRIRVSNHVVSDSHDEAEDSDLVFGDEDRSFLHARDDADFAAMQRLEGTMIHAETVEEARHICIRYLRRAREIPAESEPKRFVYSGGPDHFGREVVVLLGARLPPLGVQDERTLALFVRELEAVQSDRFLLLYVNSEVDGMDTTVLEVLQEMLAVVNAKYRSSMAQLLVLHPGLWFRAAFALGRAVSDEAASVWHDSLYLECVADLAAVLSLERFYLPDFVRWSEQQ
ncbi:Ganglioside-induced differentiation-associated protein 2 [Symbiodinium microadriaticum]|uniref:Ganglioside-induced differentiation-associated protein 2 n=1 Tax=Symbiodinium microadriaticum TaxID=2951 RepID=A0A1Q9EA85_SYMMI|nr:Ganglioside-induced differentiation-associated protein 2 [Symbiodinium microadriaticum]CAE7266783.1 gdap2 [Symbiodinium microadriaticum]